MENVDNKAPTVLVRKVGFCFVTQRAGNRHHSRWECGDPAIFGSCQSDTTLFVSTEETEADWKASKRTLNESKDYMCACFVRTHPLRRAGGSVGEFAKLSLHVGHAAGEYGKWFVLTGELRGQFTNEVFECSAETGRHAGASEAKRDHQEEGAW